ncbi:maintenance of mitochondrial morphology protein 1 [Amylocystis lapponica]|nr:maintenance of mitochondrial morphology protein 1 [Amylocystis lapponica]
MGDAYIFALQPTFTQGLIIGQASILFLLVLILKYLFFDTDSEHPYRISSYQPRAGDGDGDSTNHAALKKLAVNPGAAGGQDNADAESADWLNVVLQQVVESYRLKLRDNLPGAQGDEVARKRVETYANKMRPVGFLDPIKVSSVNLGVSAPSLSRARPKYRDVLTSDSAIELDLTYVDTVSISLSTSVLLNYPLVAFARLPISLTISLSLFSASILLTPPHPHSPHPTVTLTLPSPQSEFTLDLRTASLMGSRAKLTDVPKLHELITNQIRRLITEKGTWKIVLPGLASVQEVAEDVKKEREMRKEAFT